MLRRASVVFIGVLIATIGVAGDVDKRLRQLTQQLAATDPADRVAAARALSQYRPVYRGVVVNLIDRLSDHDEAVRRAAREALRSLAGVDGFKAVAKGVRRPPRPMSIEKPVYPDEAKARGLDGEVLLEFVIADDGSVKSVRVLHAVEGLSEAAVEAVWKWRFVPAVEDGLPTPTTAQAPVRFHKPLEP